MSSCAVHSQGKIQLACKTKPNYDVCSVFPRKIIKEGEIINIASSLLHYYARATEGCGYYTDGSAYRGVGVLSVSPTVRAGHVMGPGKSKQKHAWRCGHSEWRPAD